MSELPFDYSQRLDLHEQIARIDKLREEGLKFAAEQHKLAAEASKLKWDRWLAPLVLLASLAGGLVVAIVNHVWQ